MKIKKNSCLFLLVFALSFWRTSGVSFSQSAEYEAKKRIKLAEKSPFEKIIDRELPAEIDYEDEDLIVFVPLERQAPVHLLIVPKKRINSINDLEPEDALLVGKMFLTAKNIARKHGIAETGYRLVFNTNEDSGQSVFHIHLHLLGGMKVGPMADQKYRESKKD